MDAKLLVRLFPFVMIGLSFVASLVYFYNRDVRHGLYWLFATAINLTVTL